MTGDKYLLVGLGNPGREYRRHRHNVGFMVIDHLAQAYNLELSRVQHSALVASAEIAARSVILAKPQTYMNESGRSVGQLMRFYQIPLDHLLVVVDDLDLALGTVRFRAVGGSGGQKGMRSIIDHLGSQEFARLRLGIGRPPGRMDPAAYVLRPFGASEEAARDAALVEAVEGVHTFLRDGIEMAMSKHNGMVGAEE